MRSKIQQGVLVIVLIAVSLTSCVSNVAGDAFAFKTIKVAKDFRENLDLTRDKPDYLELDITGASNICVIDSLFCVMTGNPSFRLHARVGSEDVIKLWDVSETRARPRRVLGETKFLSIFQKRRWQMVHSGRQADR